jgi:hypothetical protein
MIRGNMTREGDMNRISSDSLFSIYRLYSL